MCKGEGHSRAPWPAVTAGPGVGGGQPLTIITGTSTDLLRQVNSPFPRHVLLGLPVILLLSAVVVWLVVGRALRPVEKSRRAAGQITSAARSPSAFRNALPRGWESLGFGLLGVGIMTGYGMGPLGAGPIATRIGTGETMAVFGVLVLVAAGLRFRSLRKID